MQAWASARQELGAAPGAALLSAFADVVIDPADGVLHQYAHVDGNDAGIYHAVSLDGETWQWGTRPVLRPGREDWERGSVGVPTVWRDGLWHMLYRGQGRGETAIGYATAGAPGGPWTRARSNPSWIIAGFERPEPAALIKVDGTYYLFVSTIRRPRVIDLWTSDDLHTWRRDPASPIWEGGRFCNEVWRHDGAYFSLVPHYRDDVASPADIELWRASSPRFADKECLGTVLTAGPPGAWDEWCLDTPSVLTSDVGRASYPPIDSGRIYVYYAGQDAAKVWRTGLVKIQPEAIA